MDRLKKFSVLLTVLTTNILLMGDSFAFSFDSSGTADAACFKDTFSKFRFIDGEIIDAKKQRYTLTGSGTDGIPSCSGVRSFTVQVDAQWDETTKQGSELILHGFPAFATTRIVSSCASNPWTTPVACKLVSYQYTPKVGKAEGGERAGNQQFPVSAGLSPQVMETIARQVAAPQDFALEPQLPPRILAPVQDEIVRRNAPLRLQIERPEDGNNRWYAENPLTFDLEFQTKKAVAAGEVLSLGGSWLGQPIIASAKQGTTTLPYSGFSKFSSQPDMDVWRVRARVQSSRAKPWSEWRVFFVEPPLKIAPDGSPSRSKPGNINIPGK